MSELPTIQAFIVEGLWQGFSVAALLYLFGHLTGVWKFWKITPKGGGQ